jgi:hypothetical protein
MGLGGLSPFAIRFQDNNPKNKTKKHDLIFQLGRWQAPTSHHYPPHTFLFILSYSILFNLLLETPRRVGIWGGCVRETRAWQDKRTERMAKEEK